MDKDLIRGRLLTKNELSHIPQAITEDISLEDLQVFPGIMVDGQEKICQRCHNRQGELFSKIESDQQAVYYCCKCLNMGRICQGDALYHYPELYQLDHEMRQASPLTWEGNFSPEQERASKELLASLEDLTRPHLVYAVTGAGKTEMIFPVISMILRKGGRVAIASPRIDVCLELFPRIKAAFATTPVTLLYGGSEEAYQYTPLVIATTHQLYRFMHAFHLVIVDEVDSFPYVDDPGLHFAAQRAMIPDQGKLIYLTATPDQRLNEQIRQEKIGLTTLPARFHGHPLPEPKFLWIGNWQKQIEQGSLGRKLSTILKKFMAIDGRKLIFMPSISLTEKLYQIFVDLGWGQGVAFVHSKDPNRKEKVSQLRDGKLECLLSTTILERGVTFENCHVFVMGAESERFTASSLVQISGRVGRKPDFPKGELIFGHFGKSWEMLDARQQIIRMNKLARNRGLFIGSD